MLGNEYNNPTQVPRSNAGLAPSPSHRSLREHRRELLEVLDPAEGLDLPPHVHLDPGGVRVIHRRLPRGHPGDEETPLGRIYSVVSLGEKGNRGRG